MLLLSLHPGALSSDPAALLLVKHQQGPWDPALPLGYGSRGGHSGGLGQTGDLITRTVAQGGSSSSSLWPRVSW